MRYGRISEEELAEMKQRVSGSTDARRTTAQSGSRRDPAIHKTTSRRGESAPSPYKSKWEAAYAAKLELEKQAGVIKQWWYEPFSLWLPGKVRYKPDFMIEREAHAGSENIPFSEIEIIEVKGWSKNRRDGMTRLKIAAALFPCFVWRLVYRTKGGGWDGEYI